MQIRVPVDLRQVHVGLCHQRREVDPQRDAVVVVFSPQGAAS